MFHTDADLIAALRQACARVGATPVQTEAAVNEVVAGLGPGLPGGTPLFWLLDRNDLVCSECSGPTALTGRPNCKARVVILGTGYCWGCARKRLRAPITLAQTAVTLRTIARAEKDEDGVSGSDLPDDVLGAAMELLAMAQGAHALGQRDNLALNLGRAMVLLHSLAILEGLDIHAVMEQELKEARPAPGDRPN